MMARTAIALGLGLLLVACQAPRLDFAALGDDSLSREQHQTLDELKCSVLKICSLTSGKRFSAVIVGERLLLTAAHAVRPLFIKNETGSAVVNVAWAGSDGRTHYRYNVELELVSIGTYADVSSDWAILSFDSPEIGLSAPYCPNLPVPQEEQIVLLGYPKQTPSGEKSEISVIPAIVRSVDGNVVEATLPPEWPFPLGGYSGGAAAIWDKRAARFTVFAIGATSSLRTQSFLSSSFDEHFVTLVRVNLPVTNE